eukprot:TRINITY_DN2511_c3_g1_i1.p1 TRINITY_DN2511_c3_g1~~TRINITY_DN2511_c3_g1_i1.p1  ORF type:complete len:474 (+),score=45.20 TRINITY_DN2511_c3_g1_i1:57-1424(+)
MNEAHTSTLTRFNIIDLGRARRTHTPAKRRQLKGRWPVPEGPVKVKSTYEPPTPNVRARLDPELTQHVLKGIPKALTVINGMATNGVSTCLKLKRVRCFSDVIAQCCASVTPPIRPYPNCLWLRDGTEVNSLEKLSQSEEYVVLPLGFPFSAVFATKPPLSPAAHGRKRSISNRESIERQTKALMLSGLSIPFPHALSPRSPPPSSPSRGFRRHIEYTNVSTVVEQDEGNDTVPIVSSPAERVTPQIGKWAHAWSTCNAQQRPTMVDDAGVVWQPPKLQLTSKRNAPGVTVSHNDKLWMIQHVDDVEEVAHMRLLVTPRESNLGPARNGSNWVLYLTDDCLDVSYSDIFNKAVSNPPPCLWWVGSYPYSAPVSIGNHYKPGVCVVCSPVPHPPAVSTVKTTPSVARFLVPVRDDIKKVRFTLELPSVVHFVPTEQEEDDLTDESEDGNDTDEGEC